MSSLYQPPNIVYMFHREYFWLFNVFEKSLVGEIRRIDSVWPHVADDLPLDTASAIQRHGNETEIYFFHRDKYRVYEARKTYDSVQMPKSIGVIRLNTMSEPRKSKSIMLTYVNELYAILLTMCYKNKIYTCMIEINNWHMWFNDLPIARRSCDDLMGCGICFLFSNFIDYPLECDIITIRFDVNGENSIVAIQNEKLKYATLNITTGGGLPNIKLNIQSRTVIYYGRQDGRRKNAVGAVTRFYRLNWGAWLYVLPGRRSDKWRKSWWRLYYERQHYILGREKSLQLEKMITPIFKKPKYFIDDPYEPYQKRHNFECVPYGKNHNRISSSYIKQVHEY
ncbi:39S ribosomal protein L35: mitochondrial-like protein [Dinothrombium tinctorium]|nr:39S ribosomal protein L35: mitochondrial-like protein [Dinothrombium tinctorium]